MTDTVEPPLSKVAFDQAERLAGKALELSRKHGVPPNPRAFEVWYAYAEGIDRVLRARVEAELLRGSPVDPDRIDEIYEEHFLQKRLSRGFAKIGDDLDSGLQETLNVIREGSGSNRAFLEALKKAQEKIARVSRDPHTRRLVLQLLQLSEDHAKETEEVGDELAKTRAEVEELQRELHTLRDNAYLDHLTQIPNRRHMDEVLEREIAAARRSHSSLAFALIDIDHFKKLNDSYGHAVGDGVLKHFAALLRDNIKGQDTPARFGGEEFAIIFPRTSLFGASQAAENLRKLLSTTQFMLSRDRRSIGQVTASFGVTQLLPADAKTNLIERADEMLYRAKRMGRNRVETDM